MTALVSFSRRRVGILRLGLAGVRVKDRDLVTARGHFSRWYTLNLPSFPCSGRRILQACCPDFPLSARRDAAQPEAPVCRRVAGPFQ